MDMFAAVNFSGTVRQLFILLLNLFENVNVSLKMQKQTKINTVAEYLCQRY